MSDSELAVRVEGLGKMFNLNLMPHLSLKEEAERRMERIQRYARAAQRDIVAGRLPKLRYGERANREFWALRDVSFELRHGEVLGIIGLNGSGKSTLLKILAQVMAPTEGRAELHGRVGALLEIGTGFNPELSGRENIYLYGSVLGMDRPAISRRFDEIVAFAGIEEFLEEPIKHYSSGMYSRLGFSVAAHLECDILLVDEVLSVGDATFTTKCYDKMRELTGQGRAVIFVSHGMSSVDNMCDNGMVLENGRIAFAGLAEEAIDHYMAVVRELLEQSHRNPVEFPLDESKLLQFRRLRMCNRAGDTENLFRREEQVIIECDLLVRSPDTETAVTFSVRDSKNNAIIYTNDKDSGLDRPFIEKPGEYSFRVTLPKNLFKTGRYFITPNIIDTRDEESRKDYVNLMCFMVEDIADGNIGAEHRPGLIAPDVAWEAG